MSIKDLEKNLSEAAGELESAEAERAEMLAELSEAKSKASQNISEAVKGGKKVKKIASEMRKGTQDARDLAAALDLQKEVLAQLENQVHVSKRELGEARLNDYLKQAGDIFLEAQPLYQEIEDLADQIFKIYTEARTVDGSWNLRLGDNGLKGQPESKRKPILYLKDTLLRSVSAFEEKAKPLRPTE